MGNVFKGDVINDDYAFSAYIPNELLGWGGVSPDAPFHGFTVFLNTLNLSDACIDFEIHRRIDNDEERNYPDTAHHIRLGNISGWELIQKEKIMGMEVKIVRTSFSYEKGYEVIDGIIIMSILERDYLKGKVIYDKFLESFQFNEG